MNRVICTSCRKPLGLSRQRVGRIYCSDYCTEVPPVTDNESRDALVAEAVSLGARDADVAVEIGVSRQRVGQIWASRFCL